MVKMRPCKPCGCSNRQGAYTVAIISIVQYCLHILAITLAITGTFDSNLTETQLYSLLLAAIILVIMSCLLFLGIRLSSKCLILPWLIMTVLADIGYLSTMMGALVLVVTNAHNDHDVIAFILALFNFLIVTYVLWVVIRFFMDLFSKHSQSEYQGLDEEDGHELKSSKGRKSTIADRILPKSSIDD